MISPRPQKRRGPIESDPIARGVSVLEPSVVHQAGGKESGVRREEPDEAGGVVEVQPDSGAEGQGDVGKKYEAYTGLSGSDGGCDRRGDRVLGFDFCVLGPNPLTKRASSGFLRGRDGRIVSFFTTWLMPASRLSQHAAPNVQYQLDPHQLHSRNSEMPVLRFLAGLDMLCRLMLQPSAFLRLCLQR